MQRVRKLLAQMSVQLAGVISDVMGQTGQAIIRNIVAGQRNPRVPVKRQHGRTFTRSRPWGWTR